MDIPIQDVLKRYQQALADATQRAILAEAGLDQAQAELAEARAELASLREQTGAE